MTTRILGVSAFYHDSAACLLVDGEIVAAAQEERFTRKKHDERFPAHAIDYCLREGGVDGPTALDYVAFYDKPLLTFDRLLETYVHHAPKGLRSFLEATPLWLTQKLHMKKNLRKELGFEGPVVLTEHHESHAASAFFPSPYSRAAILTMDGVGEWATASIGLGEGNRIKLLNELHFPHSLGLFYSAFTYFTGFKVNSGEYKLMGLAPYGEPRFEKVILDELIDIREDGSFKLNLKYFDYCAGTRMTSPELDRLFGGPPREPESPLTQREMDLAASVQAVTETVMLKMANHAHKVTGAPHLVLAGGVALNCVGNGRILREGPFEGVWIQPAAGDAGGSLGAALFVHHQLLDNPRDADGRKDSQKASLLGPAFGDAEIGEFLASKGARAERIDDPRELVDQVAGLLADSNVVGWFQGRMEFGPRALGGRSILGDPRNPDTQSRMNLKIKFRESFRPFAPTVLREQLPEWFEMDADSPYMLLVCGVRGDRRIPVEDGESRGIDKLKHARSVIPAVTHIDHSARVQTVGREDNPLYYALIERFFEKTGCPVIVNTSFNVRGEPIVCTPDDAYRCFMRTNMDALVMGSYLVTKTDSREVAPDASWATEFALD